MKKLIFTLLILFSIYAKANHNLGDSLVSTGDQTKIMKTSFIKTPDPVDGEIYNIAVSEKVGIYIHSIIISFYYYQMKGLQDILFDYLTLLDEYESHFVTKRKDNAYEADCIVSETLSSRGISCDVKHILVYYPKGKKSHKPLLCFEFNLHTLYNNTMNPTVYLYLTKPLVVKLLQDVNNVIRNHSLQKAKQQEKQK